MNAHFKSFPTEDEARRHPYPNVSQADWDVLCEYFASDECKVKPNFVFCNFIGDEVSINCYICHSNFYVIAEKESNIQGEQEQGEDFAYLGLKIICSAPLGDGM